MPTDNIGVILRGMVKQLMVAVEPFAAVRDEALAAFGEDPAYAVSMAKQANTILNKRAVWALRMELREAESKARSLCRESGSFVCRATTPCGTGQCKFAEGDLTLLEMDNCSGEVMRPQKNPAGAYSLESALAPLKALRSGTAA